MIQGRSADFVILDDLVTNRSFLEVRRAKQLLLREHGHGTLDWRHWSRYDEADSHRYRGSQVVLQLTVVPRQTPEPEHITATQVRKKLHIQNSKTAAVWSQALTNEMQKNLNEKLSKD